MMAGLIGLKVDSDQSAVESEAIEWQNRFEHGG
jgi:hypothetical protein